MDLVQIGVNHRTAPLKIRDRLSLDKKGKKNIATILKNKNYISEIFLLSTCNRMEFYLKSKHRKKAKNIVLKLMEDYSGLKSKNLLSYIYCNYEFAAVKHLYKVGSGLDSLVIGEPQILGQIKSEYELAKKFNITDTYLNHLCLETIRVSKRVRNETTINQRAVSVSYAAVELAGEIFGSLNGEKVMILGAGENSELVLKNLVNYGVKGVLVANRTYKKGKRLAHKYEGEVIHWESVENYVNEVDIIIASTGAPHLVLNKSDVNETLKNKKGPMFIIDIAVPRDIDPAVKEIAGVHLYNIDNLKEIINKNLELRKKEADKALQIIEDEVENFRSWVRKRKSVPLIKEMRENAKEIKEEEVKRALHRLQKSEDDAEKIVTNLAHRLVNKLLHRPTVGLKKIAASGDRKKDLELVKKVFPGCDQY